MSTHTTASVEEPTMDTTDSTDTSGINPVTGDVYGGWILDQDAVMNTWEA